MRNFTGEQRGYRPKAFVQSVLADEISYNAIPIISAADMETNTTVLIAVCGLKGDEIIQSIEDENLEILDMRKYIVDFSFFENR